MKFIKALGAISVVIVVAIVLFVFWFANAMKGPDPGKVDAAVAQYNQQAQEDGYPLSFTADVGAKISSGKGVMDLGATDVPSFVEATQYAKDLTRQLSDDAGMSFYVELGGTINSIKVLSTPWTDTDHVAQFTHSPVPGVQAVDFTGFGYEVILSELANRDSISGLLEPVNTAELGSKKLEFRSDDLTSTILLAKDKPLDSAEVARHINGLRDMATEIVAQRGVSRINPLAYHPEDNSVNIKVRCEQDARTDLIDDIIATQVATNGWEPIHDHGCA